MSEADIWREVTRWVRSDIAAFSQALDGLLDKVGYETRTGDTSTGLYPSWTVAEGERNPHLDSALECARNLIAAREILLAVKRAEQRASDNGAAPTVGQTLPVLRARSEALTTAEIPISECLLSVVRVDADGRPVDLEEVDPSRVTVTTDGQWLVDGAAVPQVLIRPRSPEKAPASGS